MHSMNISRSPIINVEAENEHFEMSDSIISWIESCKSSSRIQATNGPKNQRTSDNQIFNSEDRDSDLDSNLLRSCHSLSNILPHQGTHHNLSATGLAWNLVTIFSDKYGFYNSITRHLVNHPKGKDDDSKSQNCDESRLIMAGIQQSLESSKRSDESNSSISEEKLSVQEISSIENNYHESDRKDVQMRGNDEWAPPRSQIIFIIHEDSSFRKCMQRQNYRCAGCGSKIDLDLARRLVLYCHYFGKYFCKCCFSHKSIHLPGYILQKWDFHKYPVSYFALQLIDRISNEPLFNINDINPSLYRKVKKLRSLIDIRMQLYYLKLYISTCTVTETLIEEYSSFSHQYLLQDDLHLYSLNNLIEIQLGKLYEYLEDLVARSIAHIAQCDRCRAKGHYCQLCGPSSLMCSMISSGDQPNLSKLKNSESVGQGMDTMITGQSQQCQSPSQLIRNVNDNSGRGHKREPSGGQLYLNSCLAIQSTQAQLFATIGASNQTVGTDRGQHELIFPFEVGRVAQCRACGCCFHLKCFLEADQKCPKCERIQRRKAETSQDSRRSTLSNGEPDSRSTTEDRDANGQNGYEPE